MVTILTLSSSFAHCAEFVIEHGAKEYGLGISIRGQINQGDFDRFKLFLLEDDALKGYANHVWLNSPGGDVVEAMRFAELFDKSSASVNVGPYSKCYSACVFMFAGGNSRTVFPLGELGVHRLVLKSEDVAYAREKTIVVQASEDVYTFLIRQGMPQDVVAKMRDTPASEIFVFDFFDLRGRRSLDNPVYVDIVEKRCGKMPPEGRLSPAERAQDGQRLAPLRAWVNCRSELREANMREFFRVELESLLRSGMSNVFPGGSGSRAKRAVSEAFR
jgi:hypothetical protein